MSGSRVNDRSVWTLDAVSPDAMGTWCIALRDDNPIHTDAAAAEALGFGPKTVNPGPTNLAYLINMVMAARPDATIRSIDASLLGNVLADDAVLAEGDWNDGDAGGCDARLIADPGAREVLRAHIVTVEDIG